MQRFQQLIDGKFEDGQDSFESINPATGAAWALMPRAGASDVDRAVIAADRALTEDEQAKLSEKIRENLGHPFELRFSFPETIPPNPNGKMEVFVSHVTG